MSDLDPFRGHDRFVGRSLELAEISNGIEAAEGGKGGLFTLTGEAGVGKSRLAQKAAAYALQRGAKIVWGRCWENGGAPAYWPWTQALRGLTSELNAAEIAALIGVNGAEIAQIAPELGEGVAGAAEAASPSLSPPEQARFRLFEAVCALLERAAAAQPLLIVLDDLHAADAASLLMLVAFARRLQGLRVTLIGTYRSLEAQRSPEHAALLAQAEREGKALPLAGLGEEAIAELIRLSWGVSPESGLVRGLHGLTEGNPFFLTEVLRQIAAEGRAALHTSRIPAQIKVPRGVAELIRNQISPLAGEVREALDIACVIGREFDVARLARVGGLDFEAALERLDAAAALDLVQPAPSGQGRYAFRHTLIREALYEALPPGRRRALHRAVAEASRSGSAAGASEIAFHYLQAGAAAHSERVVEYSRKAARAAQAQFAFEEAAQHLQNAVEAQAAAGAKEDVACIELLCELGEAQIRTGEIEAARKTCQSAAELARAAGRGELLARAALTVGRIPSNSGVTDRALVHLLGEARDRLGASASPILAQVLARLGLELYWSDRERCVALCAEAVAMARGFDDAHTLIVALWCRWHSLRNPDGLSERLAVTAEAIELADRSGERDFALEARFYRVADLIEAGDIEGADAAGREYLAVEAELRDRFKRGLLLQAMRAIADGRLEEASGLAQKAFEAGQHSGRPLTINSFLVQRGMIAWEKRQLVAIEATLRGFIVQNPLIVFARCGLLLTLLETGRKEEARVEFERLAEGDFRLVPRDWNWLPSMFVLADVCADLGDAVNAAALRAQLAPYAGRCAVLGNVYTYGSVAFALGRLALLLGDAAQARACFEQALAANRMMRARVWVAHSQWELAQTLRLGGAEDRARAADLIASARRSAGALRLTRLQRKLEALEPAAAEESGFDGALAAVYSDMQGLGASKTFEGAMTIFFSDIVDSSALYERLGDQRAHGIVRAHNEIVRREVGAHRGVEVKSLGDSFMVVFSNARRAAHCAVAVQKAIDAWSDAHPERRLSVRIGLHVGEAIMDSADYFGRAVIIAARLAALAEGRQILTSAAFRDLTAEAGDLSFRALGERPLKGLEGTHELYEIAWTLAAPGEAHGVSRT